MHLGCPQIPCLRVYLFVGFVWETTPKPTKNQPETNENLAMAGSDPSRPKNQILRPRKDSPFGAPGQVPRLRRALGEAGEEPQLRQREDLRAGDW